MKTEICRFEIELTRNNVTPAQFLAYARSQVDKKGGRMMRSDLDLRYFKAGNDLNFDTKHDGVREKSVSRPYEMQTYIKYEDGSIYNEICEFEFDDEKTGHGYYYLVNVMYKEEPEETPEEELESAIAAEAAEEIKEERKSGIEIINSLGLTGKTWWRFYRSYLIGLACCMEPGTVEYKNLLKRAAWIENNKL